MLSTLEQSTTFHSPLTEVHGKEEMMPSRTPYCPSLMMEEEVQE